MFSNYKRRIPSLAEQLTAQFYQWELLGRGWLRGDSPVELEPQFTPFFGHFIEKPLNVDDGLHHTLLSRFASFFSQNQKRVNDGIAPIRPISYAPYMFEDETEIITFRLNIPQNFSGSRIESEQFLTMLSYCTTPISFELIATDEKIYLQISCRERDATYIQSQVQTYFPNITVVELHFFLGDILSQDAAFATVDFGMKEEFMRPLSQNNSSGINVYNGLFSILNHLQKNERVIFQILFNGVVNPWEQSILKAVTSGHNKPFFEDAPEMLPMAKEKVSSPLLTATMRVLTQSHDLNAAQSLLSKVSFVLTNASHSSGNSLIPLSDTDYNFRQRVDDILFRKSHRLGMLLNAKELATFIHIPLVQSKKLCGINRKTKSAPEITEGSTIVLGINEHNSVIKEVTISSSQRLKHTHVIGATGTGKSTLLLDLITQDILQGNGIAVFDPHGDLIENILPNIPENRFNDVVIIDPSDSEYPVGFNILTAHSDIEKDTLSSDLVAAFRKLSTSWGDQMNSVLANAILAFLESSQGGTLLDLRRFLLDTNFRNTFLKTVTDVNIVYYWQKEYPLLKSSSIGSILTRLDTFLRPKMIRNMVAQNKSLDFENLMNSKKIILIKLSQGLIGTENSYMLGTFLVSKFHQAAMARQSQSSESRNDFFLYIDEFQNFITPSMASILSGARKYRLGLILAHQDMQQLMKSDTEVYSSIANVGTRICFRLNDNDAKKLQDGFSFFDATDLQNLLTGEAICRIEKPGYDFSLTTNLNSSSEVNENVKNKIIEHSRKTYASSREEVEKIINASLQVPILEKENGKQKPDAVISEIKIKSESEKQNTTSVLPIQNIQTNSQVSTEKKIESQHRYLQTLIKKMAEARGYKATIEALIPNDSGRIDVALEREQKKIAVEISVSTVADWEVHNISKCLQAGYSPVISCAPQSQTLEKIKEMVQQKLSKEECSHVLFFEPDQLFHYLDELCVKEAATEKTVKGYRVKVEYEALPEHDMQEKRDSVARVVLSSIRKKMMNK